jgi:hypothetical protein
MFKVARVVICILAALSVSSLAQTADIAAGKTGDHPAVPTVTFTLDWPAAEPEHYVLAVDSNGRATYKSSGAQRFPGNPYSFKFTVSETTRDRIFDTARALDFFSGNFEYKKRKVAFTGQKTLAYTDASRNLETSYNWSDNLKIRQLTELFQGIATTLEFGRSLDYLRRYDKLGLNAELKRMDELAASGQLAELQVLSADLERIAGDSSVMEIARQKARRLLQRANAGGSPGSQATAKR